MNISRNFLLIGSLYLLVGISFGAYMGGSGDTTLIPVHAHLNLLGFTLMTLFGICYRLIPALNDGWMGRAHFWLHQIGTFLLLAVLFLMLTERVAETTVGPVIPVLIGMILLGILIWAVNLWRNA